jgi:hypothetical protein
MKKLFFLVLTVGALATAKAQVQFGVKAGANFASVTNADGGKTLVNFHGGALVNLPLVEHLSLQPEVVYSGQGIKGDGGKYKFNYINVPVLVQYKLPIGVFFETGPQVGFLTSAKAKEDGDGGETVSVKDYTKSIDFSWAVGAGYLIPNVNLGFDARFNLGLTKIGKEVEGVNYFDGKNAVFQVGVFYLFGGGK